MNISEPFIRRPIATSLLMAALALVGIVAFRCCRWHRCRRSISDHSSDGAVFGRQCRHNGGDGATPLEEQFGQIAGVTQ